MAKKREERELLYNIVRFIFSLSFSCFLLFYSAGTFAFVNGWIFSLCMLIYPVSFVIWLHYKFPKQIANRIISIEKSNKQRLIITSAALLLCLVLIIAGLDFRMKWSNMGHIRFAFAGVLMIIATITYIKVFSVNPYLSNAIEKQKGQVIIDTGIYSVVRHPMYMSSVLFGISMILILGSFVNFIFMLLLIRLFTLRINEEEKFLTLSFPEYSNYVKRVSYRLIPFIW